MFVARDAGGLYALTARCTHEGATCIVQSGDFYCPRHGAEFTFDGAVISGPVSHPLGHYGLCILSNGNLGLQTSTTVSATTRLVA
jgi:nitrite reductase/ring-hydroxylating ferredoxin subunit